MRPVPRLTPESFYEKYWNWLVDELEEEFGRMEAEDIVQNAFIRSLGKKCVWSSEHGEGTQLYNFRQNYLIPEIKCHRRKREQNRETSIEPGMPAPQNSNPLYYVLMSETQKEVWEIFREYWQEHPRQAEVVYLMAVDNIGPTQIGRLKNHSRNWARPIFAKGVRQLWRPGSAYKQLRECYGFLKEAEKQGEWG